MQPRRRLILTAPLGAVIAGTALAPARAAEPKMLSVARREQFQSLDPVRQFDQTSSPLVEMLYSKLIAYAYLERPHKLVPDLLVVMPELSADKLSHTFTLRPGVRFRDDPCFQGGQGRELTSDDVFFSLRRYADARLNSKSWFAMEGAVVGLDAYRDATRKAAPDADLTQLDIAGFKKLDSRRFTIRLTHENPLFLFALAMSSTAVVPAEAVQLYKDRFAVHPVGSGPFELNAVERKGVLRFTRYARYHGVYPSVGAPGDAEKGLLTDAGKPLPLVDVVEMPLIEEAQPEALMFLRGELDWRGLDRANFSKMIVTEGDGDFKLAPAFANKFDIYWAPGLGVNYIGINMKDALLGKNKALRQALARLVDTRGQIKVLLNGRGRKLKSIVPLELPGNETETGATAIEYDVAAAKRLLAEAGFPDGRGLPALSVSYATGDTDTRNAFDFLKARAAAAGVQLKGEFMDNPSFIKSIEGSNFQLAAYGWQADYADAENFYQLLYRKNTAPGPNFPAYVNAAYDRAYEASRFMVNGPQRYAHFKTMNDILRDEVPVIIEYNSLRFGTTQRWLKNFKRNFLQPEYMFLDVDMAVKRKGLA
jgi:ABC-type transport system substrate-binding protein